jgi:hypothetical protein
VTWHSSVGELVRAACRVQYGFVNQRERLSAVAELAGLSLPVGSVTLMERESVPDLEPIPSFLWTPGF